MTRAPVYICAPYAPRELTVEDNIWRACMLARAAAVEGFAPLVVHPGILPVYGSDSHTARAVGLDVDLALLELVAAHPQGELWVLMPGSGLPTAGMQLELEAWSRLVPPGRRVVADWQGWSPRITAAISASSTW
jgi:hypothetical protein